MSLSLVERTGAAHTGPQTRPRLSEAFGSVGSAVRCRGQRGATTRRGRDHPPTINAKWLADRFVLRHHTSRSDQPMLRFLAAYETRSLD